MLGLVRSIGGRGAHVVVNRLRVGTERLEPRGAVRVVVGEGGRGARVAPRLGARPAAAHASKPYRDRGRSARMPLLPEGAPAIPAVGPVSCRHEPRGSAASPAPAAPRLPWARAIVPWRPGHAEVRTEE